MEKTKDKKRTPLAYALMTIECMAGDVIFQNETKERLKHYLQTLAEDLAFAQDIIDIQEEAIDGLRAATNQKS